MDLLVEGGCGFVSSQQCLNTRSTLERKPETTEKQKETGEAGEAGLAFPRWGSERGKLLAVICTLRMKALGFRSTSKKRCPAQPAAAAPGPGGQAGAG